MLGCWVTGQRWCVQRQDGCNGGIAAEIGTKNMPPACFLYAPNPTDVCRRYIKGWGCCRNCTGAGTGSHVPELLLTHRSLSDRKVHFWPHCLWCGGAEGGDRTRWSHGVGRKSEIERSIDECKKRSVTIRRLSNENALHAASEAKGKMKGKPMFAAHRGRP